MMALRFPGEPGPQLMLATASASPVAGCVPGSGWRRLKGYEYTVLRRLNVQMSGAESADAMAEAGLVDAAYDFWVGVYSPAKSPPDIALKLHTEAEVALQVVFREAESRETWR